MTQAHGRGASELQAATHYIVPMGYAHGSMASSALITWHAVRVTHDIVVLLRAWCLVLRPARGCCPCSCASCLGSSRVPPSIPCIAWGRLELASFVLLLCAPYRVCVCVVANTTSTLTERLELSISFLDSTAQTIANTSVPAPKQNVTRGPELRVHARKLVHEPRKLVRLDECTIL